jgi:hypothetical protein
MYRLIVGRGVSVFSPARARLTMRTLSGENLAVVLAAISIAALMLDGVIITSAKASEPSASLPSAFVSIGLLAVVGMAIVPRLTLAVVALGGILAQFFLIGLEHGPEAVLTLLVLCFLLLLALALARGFSGR